MKIKYFQKVAQFEPHSLTRIEEFCSIDKYWCWQERLQKELEAQQASIEAQLTAVTHQQVWSADPAQSSLPCYHLEPVDVRGVRVMAQSVARARAFQPGLNGSGLHCTAVFIISW